MSKDPFEEYDYNPAQKFFEDGWDKNPRRPPPQVRRLWKLVEKHFPEITIDAQFGDVKFGPWTAAQWVADCDDTITFQCAQLAVFAEAYDADSFDDLNTYQQQRGPAEIFRKKLKAIEARDPSLWKEAQRNTDSRMLDLEAQAAELLGRDGLTLSDVLNLEIGPAPADDDTSAAFWKDEHAKISLALETCSGGGRPSSVYRDRAVRALVSLWEVLAGRAAVQPSHLAGSSVRANPMVLFVTEAIEIYAEFGLKGAVSTNSGAFWKRILA